MITTKPLRWLFCSANFALSYIFRMECKCGCKEDAGNRDYAWGHKTRHVRPIEKNNRCACGCGELVTTKFVKGHVHRLNARYQGVEACACGCGEMTKPGRRFLSGHNSKTLEGLAQKSEMMSRLWEESPEKFADRDVWSKGLTKKTDERLERVGRKVSATYDDVKREHYRNLGEKNAKFLSHPTGSAHPSWKGGISTIYQMLYGSRRLYEEWKFPILQAAGFRCPCGSKGPLQIHHHPVKMKEIVDEVCEGIDISTISFESRKELCERVIDRHLDKSNSIDGICLCEECHKLAHKTDRDID